MIQVTPQMRVLVAIEPADFRKGIDGLSQVCKAQLRRDPFSGTVFVFRNRRSTSIKVIVFDGQGFWLMQKRLSSGRFCFWPGSQTDPVKAFEAHELAVLLSGGDPTVTRARLPWRPVDGKTEVSKSKA